MNTGEPDPPIRSRWVAENADHARAERPDKSETAVLQEVLRAMRSIRHGSIQLQVQDGRVVQLDITEKRRL